MAAAFLFVVAFRLFVGTDASPTIIADNRVRMLDTTPVLGRGYSVGTNTFHSTCLVVNETSTPSYNYDYYVTDLTTVESSDQVMHGKISDSFGYGFIKERVHANIHKKANKHKNYTYYKFNFAATMRVDSYYSSVMEDQSLLSSSAQELLRNDDYIGFFKACGSNYVRSIRRAMEVTAVFTFESNETSTATDYAASISSRIFGQSRQSNGTEDDSLTIEIKGYGLGLNKNGSETLVATSLGEYNKAMKFAFRVMTQDNGARGAGTSTGMVHAVEVVPWVDNTAFQVTAGILEHEIKVPVPQNAFPKAGVAVCEDSALLKDKNGICCEAPESRVENTIRTPDGLRNIADSGVCKEGYKAAASATGECKAPLKEDTNGICCRSPEGRDESANPAVLGVCKESKAAGGSCEDSMLLEDRNGRCCEAPEGRIETTDEGISSLALTINDDDGSINVINRGVCKEYKFLHPAAIRNNLALNGEFVATLDGIVRNKQNSFHLLGQCIQALEGIPAKYNYYYLKALDTVKYDSDIEIDVTVLELKIILNPDGNYGLLSQQAHELDEFVEMYYNPCISAMVDGTYYDDMNAAEKYFMGRPWFSLAECSQRSCLVDGMRWDRKKGGCIPTILATGPNSEDDMDGGTSDDDACLMQVDGEGNEECKYMSTDFETQALDCWAAIRRDRSRSDGSVIVPSEMISHFCMPQISDSTINQSTIDAIDAASKKCFSSTVQPTDCHACSTYYREATMYTPPSLWGSPSPLTNFDCAKNWDTSECCAFDPDTMMCGVLYYGKFLHPCADCQTEATPTTPPPTPEVNGPTTRPTPSSNSGDLEVVGNNGVPAEVYPLGRCQGDCDRDSDCQSGLSCFQRDPNEPVPGCTGHDKDEHDYCYKRLGGWPVRSLPECYNALKLSDANGDGMIKRSEYVTFVDMLSNGAFSDASGDFSALPLPLRANFMIISCLCSRLESAAPDCCIDDKAHINVNVDGTGPDEMEYRITVCLSTMNSVEESLQ